MRIGVFDSGIGGLTVLKELMNRHPNHHYIYFGDTLNMPYGNRGKEELFRLASNIIQFLISERVDLIIIACGTISTNVYKELKEQYNIPIIDIVSPTIEYINENDFDKLGLIATNMTIKSQVFVNDKIRQQACPAFVPLIENNQIDTDMCYEKIHEYLHPLKVEGIKNLILGCTHYPLLSNKILNYFDNNINLINMGTVLANKLKLTNESEPQLELYFSKISDELITNVQNIIGPHKINLKVVGDNHAGITRS